jgi:hypothetical protein
VVRLKVPMLNMYNKNISALFSLQIYMATSARLNTLELSMFT